MTPTELRALADALAEYAESPDRVSYQAEPILQAADYLRACADAKPAGFVWYHRGLANFDDDSALRRLDDGKGTPIPLYLHPTPVAPKEHPCNSARNLS